MKIEDEEHVMLLFKKCLNGMMDKKVDKETCGIKHQEVKDLKSLVIGILMLQFTTLAGIVFALIKAWH